MKKKHTTQKLVLMLLGAVLLALPLVAADSYELYCLQNGQSINFGQTCAPGRPTVTAPNPGSTTICVHVLDDGRICHADLNTCNNLGLSCSGSGGGGGGTIDSEPPVLTVNSPEEGEVYAGRTVLLDLEANERVDIKYQTQHDTRRWTNVCGSCTSYSKERSFDEGRNDIVFRATDRAGNEVFVTRTFYVDSQVPRIRTVEPSRGFASGAFMISFDESSPNELLIHYGNSQTGFRVHEVDIETECVQNRNTECQTEINLGDYDGQSIEYYVTLDDIAGNLDTSPTEILMVDYSDPIINSFDYVVEGKKVTFTLDITEPHFSEVTYIDNFENNPREKRLCNKLTNNICEKSATFSHDGDHDVTLFVKDEAGNVVSTSAVFFTDSKAPKIKSTTPTSGYASGLFEIEFEEENTDSIILTYGNLNTGMTEVAIDVGSCILNGKYLSCSHTANLAPYNGQTVDYLFSVTDKAGQSDQAGKTGLKVDTSFPVINDIDVEVDGKRVTFRVAIDEPFLSEVTYIDNLDRNPREKRLCNRLNGGICEKKVTFTSDGDHDVTIMVKDEAGHVTAESVEFFTDSKAPRINDVSPSDREYAAGSFVLEFREQNPVSVLLNYGNEDVGFRQREFNLNSCLVDEDEYTCAEVVDISDYDGSEIAYTFTVTDRAGQTDEDGEDNVNVDLTFPVINDITFEADGNRAEVTIDVTELNLEENVFTNIDDSRPREARFCSRLDTDGTCTKRLTLNEGTNRIDFQVFDEAGNSAAQRLTIEV